MGAMTIRSWITAAIALGLAVLAPTSNVAFGEGEKDLYVSVVTNGDDVTGEAKGSVVELPNVR